jgi:DNA-binding MurR/RpiR family transcriptional regulator
LLKNIKAIQNTYSLCNADELCAVVKDMFQCQHLCLFGIGASFLVARDFQQKLERIGTHAILYEDVHMQMVTAENMTEQDCGILITYSGRTKEMIAVAEMLKRRGSSICSITQYSRNDVADLADRRLYVPKIEGPLRASASSSRISQLSVVDMLYHLYLEKAGQTEKDRIAATQQLLEKENY